MSVVGLTGSIGMGKSTAAGFLRSLGVPVYEADSEVHKLYAQGGAAVAPIGKAFPDVVRNGAVDRAKLSELLRANPAKVPALEAIVHPLARGVQQRFLHTMALRGEPIVVLDIPLLFETGGDRRCDAVIVVSAPDYIQRQRVLRRAGMTMDKLALLLNRQMPDREKRRRADFVIESNRGHRNTLLAIRRILDALRRRGHPRKSVHKKPGSRGKMRVTRRRRAK